MAIADVPTVAQQRSRPIPRATSSVPPPTRDLLVEDFLVKYGRKKKTVFAFSSGDVSLQWQKEPLKASLLSMTPNQSQAAVGAFKQLLLFMGDSTAPILTPRSVLIGNVVSAGTSIREIRDEIFLQICKQMTNCPSADTVVEGFKALVICASAFAPSREFAPYLSSWAVRSLNTMPAHDPMQASTHTLQSCIMLKRFFQFRLRYTIEVGPLMRPTTVPVVDDVAHKGVRSHMIMFGGNLQWIMKLQAEEGLTLGVPQALHECLRALANPQARTLKGIFRTAAEKHQVQREKEVMLSGTYDLLDADLIVVADLLKAWLRELHPPVIPIYRQCIDVAEQPDACLDLVMKRLPKENVRVLAMLTRFLRDLARSADQTGMDVDNLATVFAPNLLRDETPAGTNVKELANLARVSATFVGNLIRGWPQRDNE
ncbi:Rho-GAP domain-containing protein [Plasmodiophora brassicae]